MYDSRSYRALKKNLLSLILFSFFLNKGDIESSYVNNGNR